ncbi:MAG: thioredoxin family protein [Gammaproteobacteria bacterium]|nr:thioredoxin family protein [Gammaproteobacteria bacterium]
MILRISKSAASLVLAVLMASTVAAQSDSGVDFFDGKFEEALEQAKSVELPLFMYLSIPNCAPCEFVEKNVFTDTEVGEFMKARFVSFKIDAYDESANGPAIAKRYSVGSYPTYLILDHEGALQQRATSSMNSSNFMRSISWLTGEISSPMDDHDALYEAGERGDEFLQEYLLDSILALSLMPKDIANWEENMRAYGNAQDKYTSIMNQYMTNKSPQDLINSTDFRIISRYAKYRNDKGVVFVIDNFEGFVDATSMEEVSGYLLAVIADNAFFRAMEGDPTYIELIDSLEEEPLKRATEFKRSVDRESGLLPENQREHLAVTFSEATKEAASEEQE